jgi:hypothetical protein
VPFGRSSPLSRTQVGELAGTLTRAGFGRQRPTHPWPQPLPASWTGQWGEAQPVAYTPVEPTVVAEISVDTALERGRYRHPVRYVRPRSDLSPYDVPHHRWEDL